MKHTSLIYLIFGAGLSLIFACSQSSPETTKAKAAFTSLSIVEIPQLLDRPEALRYGTEWDAVQNAYGAHSAKLRNNPQDLDACLKLAEIFIQEARVTGEHPHYYPAALKMLEPVVVNLETVEDPGPNQKDLLFRALSHQASVLLSLHDFKQARQVAEKAVALNPYNAYIYGCLVDSNVELGNYAKAVELCDKMVSIRPDLRSYARVSYLREIYGDVDGAIEAMDMAVKAGYPGYEQTEWARLQLGHLYERYDRLQDAENQYRICLALREDYPFALAALAGLEAREGHLEKAETLLKKATAIIPEVGFYIDLAKLYQQTGRTAEARTLTGQILEMLKEDSAAGHNMNLETARFYLDVLQDPDKALEYARAEYRVRPDNQTVNQLLAAIYTAKDADKEALLYLKKAGRTGSKDPELAALQQKLQ